MGTPVQITVTVDSSGAVTGFQQIGGAATTMGQEVSTSGLKGAAAVEALTKKWNEEQAAIAAVNARIKENMAAQAAQTAVVEKASKEFQGLASRQTEASVAGRLLERQIGFTDRALNQVMARSALLGPLMAGMLPIGIAAAFLPMIINIGEGIAHAAQAAGGMTEAVKKMNAETIQASQQAFTNPQTMDAAREHLNIVNNEIVANDKLKDSLTARLQKIHDESTLTQQIFGITTYRLTKEYLQNSAVDKGVELEKQRLELMQKQAELVKQAAVDQASIAAEGTGMHGFAKLKFEEAVAIKNLEDDKALDATQRAVKEYAVHFEFSQKRLQLLQGETDKTISLRHQVEDQTTTGINKILADERAAVDELTRLHQRNGTDDQQFQQQRVLIHRKALNEIAAYERQQQEVTKALQNEAILAALTGDAKIIQSAEQKADKERALYARGLVDYDTYSARIEAINDKRNIDIANADKAQAERDAADLAARTLEFGKLKEDQVNANSGAALAAVDPWRKAYQQIYDAENSALHRIQKDQDTLRVKYADDAGMLVQIDATAQAERGRVWAETNEKIRAENLHLTEQLGGELQSVFDDMTNGNIGKRILSNMEKLFFQIVAQWILSLSIMKSAAGSIFGSIVFGPGSTGAGVFGGGGGSGSGSILGSLFGGGGSGGGGSAPQGAAFQPGGIFSDPSSFAGGGLPSAIAGTGATAGGGLLPSASNALTTSTMANALGGGVAGAAGSTAGKAGGLSSLFSGGNLASMAGLGLATVGSAFGGKTGQTGALLLGLLMSGKLGPVLSTLYGTSLGLAGTGALVGGITGGLIGFGIGQNNGGLLGSLAGAGTGALTGFMVGGPVGAIVGGIIGLLGGIFGGIFGSSKRKKQANALADNTLLPDIAQISTGFDGFQVDSNSAIQQLEQLRADSQKQLDALKSQGKDVFNSKVSPAIDAAEAHIRNTQSERDRRSAQVFGPPQFDTGGLFSTMRGNAGLAVLHDGEMVINPQATKKNLPALQAMNAGGSSGHSIGNLNIYPRTLDRAYMMSSQFRKDLLDALDRARREGELVGGF